MPRAAAAVLVLLLAAPAAADEAMPATAEPAAPLHWGERAEGYATVCLERWHASRVKQLRNAAVDHGEGAMAQIAAEKQALFQGRAWCFTDAVAFTVAEHADVVEPVRTWVKVAAPDGPEDCPEALAAPRCRWTIETQRFVEATVEHPDVPQGTVVYVSTPRPLIAAPLPENP